MLGGSLAAKSWLDLRYLEDFDGVEFQRRLRTQRISLTMTISKELFVGALVCAAGADDCTIQTIANKTPLGRDGAQDPLYPPAAS